MLLVDLADQPRRLPRTGRQFLEPLECPEQRRRVRLVVEVGGGTEDRSRETDWRAPVSEAEDDESSAWSRVAIGSASQHPHAQIPLTLQQIQDMPALLAHDLWAADRTPQRVLGKHEPQLPGL